MANMFRSMAIGMLAIALVGCESDYDEGYGREAPPRISCSSFSSCDTCTPVLGCGWCSYGPSMGRCASGPTKCGDEQPFRWNWEPRDCPVGGPPPDAAPLDSGNVANDVGTVDDVGSGDDAGSD